VRVQPRKVVVNGAKGLLGTPTGRLFRGHADIELNAVDPAARCAESRKPKTKIGGAGFSRTAFAPRL
jgi:hypothetical protein